MRWLRLLLALCVVLFVGAAHAQTPSTTSNASSAMLPRELDALGAWLAAKEKPTCADHCFVLSKMKLGGSMEKGLTFELEGAVLAEGPVVVPLFGPPDRVRVDGATIDGAPAAIGFEGDHYYLQTAQKHFVLKGTLTLQGERALTISGPLNALEADLSEGRVAEGARLSGLASTTLHFDGGAAEPKTEEPPVFQLSRHVHVERQATFEYKLTLRAGTDLGVVRLPLSQGERVLDVVGSNGWKIDGSDVILPTAGHSADVTITGTFDALADKSFAPDARSTYEWFQVDADPEHRVTIGGDAKQMDAVESPFARTPSSRLFLVQKGQTLQMNVQTLATVEALAAVVQQDARIVVLTPRGDLVSDQTLQYENAGIDYLKYLPYGKPIFLASDGEAQKILSSDDGPALLAPLQKGVHSLRVQSISQSKTSLFGGRLFVDAASYPLTASHAVLTIGLPASVHPIAVLGGDRAQWFVGLEDAAAIVVAFIAGWSLWKTRGRRLLSSAVLVGVWFVSPTAFACVVAALVATIAARAVARLAHGKSLRAARWAIVAGAGLLALFAVATLGHKAADRSSAVLDQSEELERSKSAHTQTVASDLPGEESAKVAESPAAKPMGGNDKDDGKLKGKNDEGLAQLQFATLQGVRPVALPLPAYERAVTIDRELVTRDRPFHPVVLYVTDWALLPFGVLWIAAMATMLWIERKNLVALRDRARAWLAERPTPIPAAPTTSVIAAPPATDPPQTT